MAFIDYYKIMGVDQSIPQDQIRAAYKKRAKQFHPDLHPDDPKAKAKFQALNEAYEVLSDPEKRAKYDRYGENWKNVGGGPSGQGGAGFGGTGGYEDFDFGGFSGAGGFSSFFEELFGRGGFGHRKGFSARQAHADYNMNATVDIDMYTALLGGQIILKTQSVKLKLNVRPGTQNGTKARLRGKGYLKPDGTYGDLILTYNVKLPTHLTAHQRELLEQMRSEAV